MIAVVTSFFNLFRVKHLHKTRHFPVRLLRTKCDFLEIDINCVLYSLMTSVFSSFFNLFKFSNELSTLCKIA